MSDPPTRTECFAFILCFVCVLVYFPSHKPAYGLVLVQFFGFMGAETELRCCFVFSSVWFLFGLLLFNSILAFGFESNNTLIQVKFIFMEFNLTRK